MGASTRPDPARTQRPRPISTKIFVLIGAVALCVYGLDQLTKAIVERSLSEGEVVPVLGRVLQWYFVRNPGAAFSFAEGQTWLFTGFAIVMIVVIVVMSRRIRSARWAAVFGLVLGGVLGNLTDRLFRPPGFGVGHVVDFISTPWLIPAIYNIADMGIVFGMILFVLLTVLDVGFDGVRRGKRAADADAGTDAGAGAGAGADAGADVGVAGSDEAGEPRRGATDATGTAATEAPDERGSAPASSAEATRPAASTADDGEARS